MTGFSKISQPSFPCKYCKKAIFIPPGLPETTAPCPHCGKKVTSPGGSGQVENVPSGKDSGGCKESEIATSESTPEVIDPEAMEPPTPQVTQKKDLTMPRLVSGGVNQRRGKDSMGVVVAAAVILLVACGVVFFVSEQGKNDEPSGAGGFDQVASGPKGAEGTWLQTGWRQEATNVLNAFMSAQSPDERLKYVIPNEGVLDELKIFYPAGSDDSDTPHEFFSHVMGSKMDQKRGIFLMQYRQPAQDDVTGYFTPITSSGSSPDEEPLNVMDMAHLVDEDSLSKPIGINAFFKQTDHGMKLDASVFIQGKFRTFRAFVDYPRPGKTQVFRVVVGESLSHALRDDPDIRTYRLEDFAYPKDFINLPARVDSDVGKVLSVINWRGENRDRTIRTATVELGWSHETPSELNIVKVVCWEFLGVGGELGNAVVKSPPVPAENNTPNKKTQ